MSLDPADFALTDEQLRAEWQRIRRPLFGGVSRNPRPLVVFIGAQPGAGKTRAIDQVKKRYPDRRFVALDSDELRKTHPRFDEIMAADPDRMPVLANQAASAWVRMGLADARAGGYDVLIENSFHKPELVLATAAEFAEAGYRVEAVALAVPEADSRLSTVDRYLQARTRGLPARWTNNASHDAGYSGVPATVSALEASPIIDRVLITDRTGATLYDSTPGVVNRDPCAVDAVDRIRDTQKTAEQAATWLTRYEDLAVRVDALGIRDEPNIVPVMDRLDLTARDITEAANRPPSEPPPAVADRQDPTLDPDGPDYDHGPDHRPDGPTQRR